MAYIGKSPVIGNFVKLDAITAVNGQAAYTMQNGGVNFTSYDNVNQFLVSLNGVLQAPTDSFTVSGSTLTFASNLSTGDVIDFVLVLGNSLDIGTPSDNTISTAKLQANAVTSAKMFSTFKNGITMADEFRLTSNKTINNTSSDITANLARTTRAGFSLLGSTGMTESSGIFTFPSTGYYMVGTVFNYTTTDANRAAAIRIYFTSDNSTYYTIGQASVNASDDGGASNSFGAIYAEYLVDVTDTSNCKVKFDGISNNNSTTFNGDSSSTNDTSSCRFLFRRIGDT